VKAGEQAHSTKAYTEQSAAKVQMGLLEDLEPMSQEYLDKLEHIRGAVAHHVYEEEGTWFVELKENCRPPTKRKSPFVIRRNSRGIRGMVRRLRRRRRRRRSQATESLKEFRAREPELDAGDDPGASHSGKRH